MNYIFKIKTIIFLFTAVANLVGLEASAQSEKIEPPLFETVVKETKFNSSSRIVIDKEEIDQSKATTVTALLASQANISIAESNFTPTSIYLRGGDSSHILILVDGVPFYDASSIQRTINLNSLDLKSVERIEVIKGSQSVIYGGQALTGVIKIDTIPKKLTTSAQALVQGGTQHQGLAAAGGTKAFDHGDSAIIVRGSYSSKDDESPVLGSGQTYPSHVGSAELAYIYRGAVLDSLLKAQTSFDKTLIATTAYPAYSAADADNFETSTYQLNATGLFSLNVPMKPMLSVSAQDSARLFEQDFDSSGGSPTKQDYKGKLFVTRFELAPFEVDQVFHSKVGLNYIQEQMVYKNFDVLSTDQKKEFEAVFAKLDILPMKFLLLEAGGRLDYAEMKNETLTYQLGATIFDVVKLEHSTGFKQPSLFQLYSNYGNIDLKPERSISESISIEGNLTPDWFSSMTLFQNQFENLILIQGSPQKYENVAKSKTNGVELATGYRLTPAGMRFNLAMGYQEPRDVDNGQWLVRRPLRTASFKVHKDFERAGLGLELIHNGDRRDRTGAASYGTLSSYNVANLVGDIKLMDQMTWYARIQNIFNQQYQSSYGFYNEGLNVTSGFEYSF